jgi:DNA polymerase III delta prime subunit
MDTENENIFNQLWIEKYRPKKLEDVVLTEEQSKAFEQYIQRKDIPHMLFYGPPGSGKTTTSRIFLKNIIHSNMDVMCLNGSDTNGIDFFRQNVIEFCKTPPVSSRIKVVFIDEADGITPQTQQLLRNAMETYAANVRFILTCNFVHKIIEPLQSRCTTFEMKEMPLEFVEKFACNILDKEGVKYDKNDVTVIVKNLSPDVRKIVNLIQRKTINSVLTKVKTEELITIENKIVGLIVEVCDSVSTNNTSNVINKVFPTILDILKNEKGIELGKIYDTLFNHEGIPSWGKIVINEYANKHMGCFSQPYNFMAMCYKILQSGLQFVKMFNIKK